MSTHWEQLKSVIGISALVSLYGLASLLVWFLGPALGFGLTERIVLVALILLTWPVAILINHYRKKRAEQKAASEGGEKQLAGVAQPAALRAPVGTYEELQRSAEEAVRWLRSTKLGAVPSRDAVYSLPWFLVAGPPASGKTSLLLSAGLDFYVLPGQRHAEQNLIRPTRDCEWRVTDKAVLLDTAGRYQTEGAHSDEWSALVETLKKYRKNRPLDGVIIPVSAARVLASSEAEIEQQAKLLRTRLDEVIARTGIRFPVYLVFTHAEAIEGFSEFFHTLNPTERAAVWGATLPLEQAPKAHALFDVEFDYLSQALMRRRLVRLGTPATPAEALRVFDFPLRFAKARSKLGLLVSALFRPNPFSESPLFRGFYFTSHPARSNRGSSAPRATGTVELAPGAEAHVATRGFFTEDFFKEVLQRDRDLAASFQAVKKDPHRWHNILLGVAAAFLFFLMIGMLVSFIGNKRLIEQARARGERVDEIWRADVGKDPTRKDATAARVEIEAVDALRQQLLELDEYDRNSPPLHLRFGLYSGNAIKDPLRTIYFESINQRFFKPMQAALERELRAFTTASIETGSTASDELGRYYDLLKAYLMLAGDADKIEPTFLVHRLADYWKQSAPPELELLSQQQLEFYASQASREDAPHLRPDDRLVTEARRRLAAYPAVNRFYKRITTEIDAKVAPVSLDRILLDRGRGVLAGSYTVPGSFTIEGYRGHMIEAISSAAEEMSKEDWVMGAAAQPSQGQSADIGKLQAIYLRDYTDHWQRFLKGISVRPFNNKDEAVEALKTLSASDSPLVLVLTEVVRHTNLSATLQEGGFWGWIKSLFSRQSVETSGGTSEVEKEFRPLFQFVSAAGDKESSLLSQYRAELQAVLGKLEIKSADQLSQVSQALLTGKDELGLQKAELAVAKLLDSFKTAAARDAAALLKQPLGNLRAMLYGGGYEQIERAWREQLYPAARRLEQGFPFTSFGETSLTDLTRFLNPVNGQLSIFFNEKLASSFEEAGGQWRLKETGAFRFSDNFVNYLNSARRLREALFPTGGQQPEVAYELIVQPVPGADAVIEIDGNRAQASGSSPQSYKFTWPARAGASGARILVMRSGGQPLERSFPGEWGLFKAFAAGAPNKMGDNQYALSWNLGSLTVRADLRPASATNPFDRSLFTSLQAPQNLR
jgi:type VI secretion system protein ImpL